MEEILNRLALVEVATLKVFLVFPGPGPGFSCSFPGNFGVGFTALAGTESLYFRDPQRNRLDTADSAVGHFGYAALL